MKNKIVRSMYAHCFLSDEVDRQKFLDYMAVQLKLTNPSLMQVLLHPNVNIEVEVQFDPVVLDDKGKQKIIETTVTPTIEAEIEMQEKGLDDFDSDNSVPF